MRTTLTLDDDLARALQEMARASGRSFKSVTNETIRRGLSAGEAPNEGSEPFKVESKPCGFRSGVDPLKLNQVYDDLEIERLGEKNGFGVHEP